jgi:aminoglycoside phosphotransferase (APT) family kinase protein
VSFDLPEPDEVAIRRALSVSLPDLLPERIEPIGTGWAFWAFRAGDFVLRFPRDPEFAESLTAEAAVLRELAPVLPLPVAVIEVHAAGPNDLPFTSHRFVAGISVKDLPRPLAANSGAVLGGFLRAMHSFPVHRAVTLGLEYTSAEDYRESRRRLLEDQIRPKVFPLVTPAVALHVMQTFRAFMADPSNFAWQPVVSHHDIDDWNTLADPETGELSGVVDWGDITIGDPASDFTISLFGGFATKGINLPDLYHAYGITAAELETMRPRCAFAAYCWPLHEIIYGLDSHQDDVVLRGVKFLHETVGGPPVV